MKDDGYATERYDFKLDDVDMGDLLEELSTTVRAALRGERRRSRHVAAGRSGCSSAPMLAWSVAHRWAPAGTRCAAAAARHRRRTVARTMRLEHRAQRPARRTAVHGASGRAQATPRRQPHAGTDDAPGAASTRRCRHADGPAPTPPRSLQPVPANAAPAGAGVRAQSLNPEGPRRRRSRARPPRA